MMRCDLETIDVLFLTHSLQAMRHSFRIAIHTTRAHLCTASSGIPGFASPFYLLLCIGGFLFTSLIYVVRVVLAPQIRMAVYKSKCIKQRGGYEIASINLEV